MAPAHRAEDLRQVVVLVTAPQTLNRRPSSLINQTPYFEEDSVLEEVAVTEEAGDAS